ncbi:hypothetical protein OC842_002750 [Tilletia horrida]|uniref:Uncharacterized protein n=1 Tax=Tilletia horrida TaxID=155126 RepID=A0AAN6GCR3_9BASI|nr:hypothetical protein OC842_002750 [Tilletia horrida]
MLSSLDDIVAILRVSVCSPLLSLSTLAGLIYQGAIHPPTSTAAQALSALCVVVLLSHATVWASRLHRNGWSRTKRLSAEEWAKQAIVVTGGSGGLGREIIRLLSEKGAKVANVDLSPASQYSGARYFHCDVSDAEQVRSIAQLIQREIGQVTMLVNNAGMLNGKLLLDLAEEEIHRIIAVNLTSHIYTIKAFLPDMIAAKRGHVVTVSSVMGHIGIAQVADYVATKHALVGLHESLRYELDKK